MMNKTMLEQFSFFLEHQDELVESYNGQSVIIKDLEVVGAFDSEWDAFQHAIERYEEGAFIVQHVATGTDAYTVRIASSFVYAG